MNKPFVIGAAAIAAVAVGSIAFILFLDGSAPPEGSPDQAGDSSAVPPGSEREMPGAPAAAPAPLPSGPGGGGWQPAPAPQQDLLPEPPKGSWEGVAVTTRPAAMGPVAVAIAGELRSMAPAVAPCFDEMAQARFGKREHSEVQYAPSEDTGTTMLVLQIQTGEGEAEIVDAPVEARGGASDGLLACAQAALRGHKLSVPGAKPGERFRMRYMLAQ
jgi:hypothetical protein